MRRLAVLLAFSVALEVQAGHWGCFKFERDSRVPAVINVYVPEYHYGNKDPSKDRFGKWPEYGCKTPAGSDFDWRFAFVKSHMSSHAPGRDREFQKKVCNIYNRMMAFNRKFYSDNVVSVNGVDAFWEKAGEWQAEWEGICSGMVRIGLTPDKFWEWNDWHFPVLDVSWSWVVATIFTLEDDIPEDQIPLLPSEGDMYIMAEKLSTTIVNREFDISAYASRDYVDQQLTNKLDRAGVYGVLSGEAGMEDVE